MTMRFRPCPPLIVYGIFCADRATDHRTQRGDPADPHPAQSAAAPGKSLLIVCTNPDPKSFIGKKKKNKKRRDYCRIVTFK
jgi:hypothetical protein